MMWSARVRIQRRAMILTKRKAIELSCELWEWLAKTGKKKRDWPGWEENGGKYPDREGNRCFLCNYVPSHNSSCMEACPYCIAYGSCCEKADSPYILWLRSPAMSDEKKHYAGEFLAQLQTLLEEGKCQRTSID